VIRISQLVAEVEEPYLNEGYKLFEEDFLQGKFDDNGKTTSDTKDSMSFEEIVCNMIDVTPDGGVKKQTIVDGIGEVIPPDANVTSKLILFLLFYELNFLLTRKMAVIICKFCSSNRQKFRKIVQLYQKQVLCIFYKELQ